MSVFIETLLKNGFEKTILTEKENLETYGKIVSLREFRKACPNASEEFVGNIRTVEKNYGKIILIEYIPTLNIIQWMTFDKKALYYLDHHIDMSTEYDASMRLLRAVSDLEAITL